MTNFPPQDVTNPVALLNFLQRTSEVLNSQVDLASGLQGTSEAQESSLSTLTETVEDLTRRIQEIEEQVIFNGRELGDSYFDFDATIWGVLRGYYRFSALGSAMTNPPVALTGGTTYVVHAHNVTSFVGGVWQVVAIENTGTDLKVFHRTGDTFAQAITNGWTQV